MNILRQLLVSTFCALLPICASVAEVVTATGFHVVDQSSPMAIQSTSQSVFEVRIAFEESPNKVIIIDLTDPKFKDVDSKVDAIEKLDAHDKLVIHMQIEQCRRLKNEKACPVFFTIERATAFLAGGDGSYLLTNAHVVNGYLKLFSAAENKSIPELLKAHERLLIFIFDQSGHLIFDPYLETASIVKWGTPSLSGAMKGLWYSEDSDYVVIELSKNLGKPIPIASRLVAGEKLYHSGFAGCTACSENPNVTDPELNRDRTPEKNSSGKDFVWTSGINCDLSTAADFLGVPPAFFDTYLKANLIFFSADAQVGMSGGPILNEKAEVVGVFAGAKPKIKADGALAVMSRGVRPVEFQNK